MIKFEDDRFASCSSDKTVKLWRVGNKKPYKNIKFPSYVHSIELVKDEYGVEYLIAALGYDSGSKGDLVSIKVKSLKQFAVVKKAHKASILHMRALSK